MVVTDLSSLERLAAAAPVLLAFAARAAAVLALGMLVAMLARGAAAATRHMIWALTLAGTLLVPIAAMFVPHWPIPVPRWTLPAGGSIVVARGVSGASSNVVLSLAPRDVSASSPAAGVSATESHTESVSSTVTASSVGHGGTVSASTSYSRSVTYDAPAAAVIAASTSRPARPVLGLWLTAVWLAGVVVALLPTMIGMLRLRAIARRARPMVGGRWALLVPSAMRELDVRRRVRFVEVGEAVMPMTWGVVHPVVLLPAGDFDSTIEQRLDVLRHELAHVRRYDCLTQLVGQVACAVHWFNPLAWLAARQMRVERERACDDEVLGVGARPSAYADYLLRVARSTSVVGAAALGGLAMARPSQMAGRLLAVLDERRPRGRATTRATAHAAVATAAVVATIGSVTPVAADARMAAGQPVTAATTVHGRRGSPLALNGPTSERIPVAATAPVFPAAARELPLPMPVVTAVVTSAPTVLTRAAAATLSATLPPPAHTPVGPCDSNPAGRKSGSHTNLTSSDNGAKRWRVMWSEGDCSYEIDARGDIRFNRDVTDIESISSGGSFSIEEHIGDDTRRLVVRPTAGGGLERTYSVNGARQDYDAAARAWFAEALVALDRRTAFAVDQRVPAILDRSGVEGVLQEITLVESDYARRRYYTKLLSLRRLDAAQVRRVVEQAGASMSSDYELAELLVALAKLDAFDDASHPAFVAAAKNIGSDYERRRALNALLQRDRLAPPTVKALLETASSIESDYELATLLIDVSKRYAINDDTRPIYIGTLASIGSDYEHRRVLSTVVASGGLTPAATRALLEDARRIGSDYELAEFLIQVAKAGGLDASTRDAYFAAADKIGSDYEHHRALAPLLTRDLLTKEIARSVLASAAKIESDYECASLLVEVANAIAIDDDLRPAFEKAADTIEGQYEYGRAMSAIRRRVTR